MVHFQKKIVITKRVQNQTKHGTRHVSKFHLGVHYNRNEQKQK